MNRDPKFRECDTILAQLNPILENKLVENPAFGQRRLRTELTRLP